MCKMSWGWRNSIRGQHPYSVRGNSADLASVRIERPDSVRRSRREKIASVTGPRTVSVPNDYTLYSDFPREGDACERVQIRNTGI